MRKALLTIDDTPSQQTDTLTDFLRDHDIPAILFCRGDRLAANPDPAMRAVQKGFVLGNHAYSHRRFSTLTFDEGREEILRTDALIDAAYEKAGRARPAKYFRFPHMDRGAGGWIVDYDAAGPHRQTLIDLFSGGLNIDLSPPDDAAREKKARLQEFLAAEGFLPLPAAGVTFPWYRETEMAQARDAMFTFSTSDWMVTPRHAGKWPWKTVDDLKRKIDEDPFLQAQDSTHIILAHDQDDLLEVVKALIMHCLEQDIAFIKVE